MPFPVVEKKPEMIVLSEVRQRQTAIIEHHLWWNLKMDNQSQRLKKRKLWLQEKKVEGAESHQLVQIHR